MREVERRGETYVQIDFLTAGLREALLALGKTVAGGSSR